jgi:hypothetical protein
MAAVDLDRQAIERRDFPISRRGYDTTAVDTHLQAVAGELEDLRRTAMAGAGESSLASAAGSQVQSIIEAAENAAAEIERQAVENARLVREEAERDAERTRDEAVEKARGHVAGVSQAAATLSQRVAAMDGEVGALLESLRASAAQLMGDLAAVERGMGELYDAAAGRGTAASTQQEPQALTPKADSEDAPEGTPAPAKTVPAAARAPAAAAAGESKQQPAAGGEDLDGARLIALNMALNGESREYTERYLAENFQLSDRVKLVDEVYAAIEG